MSEQFWFQAYKDASDQLSAATGALREIRSIINASFGDAPLANGIRDTIRSALARIAEVEAKRSASGSESGQK